ncbi:MAG: T9SS type A sorting domain-containing protein [Calditrichales bacterium]|nr:T9SS type A sorting domain-containing protein [Calditrichales bacterium]
MKRVLLFISLAVFGLFAVLSANEKNVKQITKNDAAKKVAVQQKLSQAPIFLKTNSTTDFTGGLIWLEDFENSETWDDWIGVDLTDPRPERGPSEWLVDSWEAVGDSSWRCADTSFGNNGGYDNEWYQVLDTPPILINDTEAAFTFYHRYYIEGPGGATAPYDGWDGCNVRISVDSGATWQVLPAATYNVTSCWAFGHPSQGHNEGPGIAAWAGQKSAWTKETFDLTDYTSADTAIMLRFAFAADKAYSTVYHSSDDAGNQDMFCWQIDSIEVRTTASLIFSNYGNTVDMTGSSQEFIPPLGGNAWHIVEISPTDSLLPYYPEYEPTPTHAAACQVSGSIFGKDSTYSPWMENVYVTGPISIPPDLSIVPLDYLMYQGYEDLDDFPDREYWRFEVSTDSVTWGYPDNNPEGYVSANQFPYWFQESDYYESGITDLTSFSGDTIWIRFHFWSDEDKPMGPGLLIDDIAIFSPTCPPAPPQNVAAVPNPPDTSIIVTWDYADTVTYSVWRMAPGDDSYWLQAKDITDSAKYIDNDVEPLYEYYYVVTAAIKYKGRSDLSNEASANVVPEKIVEFAYDDFEAEGYYESPEGKNIAVKFTPMSYPVKFQTIKIYLDKTGVTGTAGHFSVWSVNDTTGLPDAKLQFKNTSGLDQGANIVTFIDTVTIDSNKIYDSNDTVYTDHGGIYIAFQRFGTSPYVAADSSAPDSNTYVQNDSSWTHLTGFDAMIHVFLDTTGMVQVVGIKDSKPVIAHEFILGKNYPNPFNPVTNIPFVVPAKAAGKNVKLNVYNILGQKVAALFDGKAKPGLHTVQWKGLNSAGKAVSSGIYIYRLKSGDISLSKRMLFIK